MTIAKTIFLSFCFIHVFSFITVQNRTLMNGTEPYHFMGTNFWYGMNLAVDNAARLTHELDTLKSLGITNLRIMGSSQGPDSEPYRMVPALEIDDKFTFNETILDGLDLLLFEMKKRKMLAVVPLNDFWHWSGGFPQYVRWFCTDKPIPYPYQPNPNDTPWDTLVNYTKQFYTCQKAIDHYNEYYTRLATHKNKYTGIQYKDDDTIMAWQIANEPWPADLGDTYTKWLNDTLTHIKTIDKNHIVSVGIEGLSSDPNYEKNSMLKLVDYMTCHLWAQNWGWYDPKDPKTFTKCKETARKYMEAHIDILTRVEKPFTLEEFGLARDLASYDPLPNNTKYKDEYYEMVFEIIYNLMKTGKASGVNFWAWAGNARPPRPGQFWKPGDPWLGDPPHEPQGWYSVYDTDSTVEIIRKYAKLYNEVNKKNDDDKWPYFYWIIIGAGSLLIIGSIVFIIIKCCKKSDKLEFASIKEPQEKESETAFLGSSSQKNDYLPDTNQKSKDPSLLVA